MPITWKRRRRRWSNRHSAEWWRLPRRISGEADASRRAVKDPRRPPVIFSERAKVNVVSDPSASTDPGNPGNSVSMGQEEKGKKSVTKASNVLNWYANSVIPADFTPEWRPR